MPKAAGTRTPSQQPHRRAAAARRSARAARCAGVLGCLVALSGCGAAQKPGARSEDTVLALARALSEGKLDVAYALMSPEYKQHVSFEQWQKQLTENPQELTETSSQLTHLQPPTREEAYVRYGDDGELRLRKVEGRWLVDSDVLSFYDQSTPRAALVAFVRAMEAKRYDVVMRLIPNADKEGMTTDGMATAWAGEAREEVERMLTSLHDHRDDPIEIAGDHATMAYGERRRVQFVREDGVWKIEDPQ